MITFLVTSKTHVHVMTDDLGSCMKKEPGVEGNLWHELGQFLADFELEAPIVNCVKQFSVSALYSKSL